MDGHGPGANDWVNLQKKKAPGSRANDCGAHRVDLKERRKRRICSDRCVLDHRADRSDGLSDPQRDITGR